MAIISTLPYNISNGTLEDANQVMGNFNQIVSQVNTNLSALTGAGQIGATASPLLSGITVQAQLSQVGNFTATSWPYTPPGTGAVATTVGARLNQTWIYDAAWNSDPTGATDNSTNLNAALTALAAAGGGTLVLPFGTFLISATVNRPAGIYIVGQGPEATTLLSSTSFNGNIIATVGSSSSVQNRGGIQNLCIIGSWGVNNANTASVAISNQWTNRCIIRDVRIHGCYIGIYGIGIWQDTWDNVHVDGGGTQQNYIGFYLDQLPTTFPVGTSNAVNAIHCTTQGVGYCGFRLLNPNGSKFTGCEAENGVYGMFIGNTASGCYPIEFFTCTGFLADTNTSYGIVVQQGSNAVPCTYMQFANCWTSTHGQTAFYLDGCTYINISNHQAGNNTKEAIVLHNSQYCVINGAVMQGDNTGNSAGLGDITISGGGYNKVFGCLSNMVNATSVSILESNATDNNTIESNTIFQGATIIGAHSRVRNNQGYNPVGISGPTNAGASPWTYTAGSSPETHYLQQSATNTAVVTQSGKTLGTLTAGTTLTVELDPGGAYQVTWLTTTPTYIKFIH
jgi:hypothetical protein